LVLSLVRSISGLELHAAMVNVVTIRIASETRLFGEREVGVRLIMVMIPKKRKWTGPNTTKR
jgi:hypothetical protein